MAAIVVLASLALGGCSTDANRAGQLATHDIARGYFELTTPADWTLTEEKLESWQEHSASAASLRIQNGDGQDMAILMTGGNGPVDLSPGPTGEKYTQLDNARPALNAKNHFAFESLGEDGHVASINLNFYEPGPDMDYLGLQSLIAYDDHYGIFKRDITADEPLSGVSSKLKGMERLTAYAKTDEYARLKAMMLSLSQAKPAP